MRRHFFWVGILILAVFYLIPGFVGWPGLHVDAFYYATPVISSARGEGWLFGGFPHLLDLYPDRLYRGHGFIHIVIFGEVLRCSTWQLFFIWCGVVNATSALIWGIVCRRQFQLHSSWLRDCVSLSAANLAGLSGIGLQGRPEHLAVLTTGILLLILQLSKKSLWADAAVAISTAILFCMSPVLGVLMSCGVACYVSIFWPGQQGVWGVVRFASIGFGALVISALLIMGAGFDMLTWIRDTSAAFSTHSGLFSLYLGYQWVKYWCGFSSYLCPFWNLLFCLASCCLVLELLLRRCWWAVLYVGINVFVFSPSLMDYSCFAFLPTAFVVLVRCGQVFQRFENGKWSWVCCLVPASFMVIHGLVTLRIGVLILLYLNSGISVEQARAQVVRLRQEAKNGEIIAFAMRVNASPIVLDDPGTEFLQSQPSRQPGLSFMNEVERIEASSQKLIRFYLYPQTYRGVPPHKIYLGNILFKLIQHNWRSDRTKVMGLPLGGPFPGYQFAVYERVE